MLKRLLLVTLVAVMLVGCMPTAALAEGETYKIYLITMDQIDLHWVSVDAGCKQAAEELGNVDYQWLAPDKKDDAQQIECINNAIAGNADAILLAANGPDAVTGVLEEAVAEGITIVYVDSPANFPAVRTLATDNKQAGVTAGQQMLAALEAKGITEGKIGIVTPNASTNSNVNREMGFREVFEGTAYTLLESQYSDGDAARSREMATNFITEGVVGLFGSNEGCSVGVGNAIEEAGNTIVGVGFDKSDALRELIMSGALLCTMAQNPDVMGYEGMKTAVDSLQGTAPESEYYDTGVSVLTADKL